MKILCVLIPHFALVCEIQRHPELVGRAIAVTYSEGSQKLILDFSEECKGLQRDMPLQKALSMYGEIELVHADIPFYQSTFNEVLDALELTSPLVEGNTLGEVYIGIDGLHLIYPNHDILADAVREAIPQAFEAHLGIAEGKFPAYLAALKSAPQGYQTLDGDLASEIKGLPSDILPLSQKSKTRLHDFGLHTLGHLAVMSPAHLQAQFGPEGRMMWELANGRDDTPLYPRLSEECIEESTTLPSITVSLDLLIMALESLLSKAFTHLNRKGLGIRSIKVWTHSWVGEHWEQSIHFKEPAMSSKAMLSRIRQVVENTPQPGPVEQLGMKITGVGRPHGRQSSLISQVRAQEHLVDEIRQLELRLGGPQLFQMKEVEPWSRIPERRYTLAPLNL